MQIKPTYVTFKQSKWLKEKGFAVEVEFFYSKHGAFNWLKPHREYEHLHNYSEQIEPYFTGKYNWNSLCVDEGMVCLKTSFSECDEWCNCECSAPEQWQVLEWIRLKYSIHVFTRWNNITKKYYWFIHEHDANQDEYEFNSPQEAYSAAFDYILENNLI